MNKKEFEKMLSELAEITKKYNVILTGCSCCGSPYIATIKGNNEYGNPIYEYICDDVHLYSDGTYEYSKYDNILKEEN